MARALARLVRLVDPAGIVDPVAGDPVGAAVLLAAEGPVGVVVGPVPGRFARLALPIARCPS